MLKEETIEIQRLLRKKYAPPEYAFFLEVANGTGSGASRYADGVAVNLWPSKGHEVLGFEIKVSRADFLNEMKKPWKSDSVMKYCHKWYLVAPKGLIKKEEIPVNWGFIEVANGKLYNTKLAPHLEPVDMTRSFCSALLRRSTESSIPLFDLEKWKEDMEESAKSHVSWEAKRNAEKLKELQDKVSAFEKASGINISNTWEKGEVIGRAVDFVLNGGFSSFRWKVKSAVDNIKEIAEKLKEYEEFANMFEKEKK